MRFKKIIGCVLSLLLFNYQVRALDVGNMKLDEKLGQMMCLSFECTEMNEEVENIISKYHIGSVVLFAQNFVDEEQSKKLIKSFKETALKSGNPPLIVAVDQEGGRIERFSFGRERLKNNAEIKTAEEAFEKGNKIAKELKEMGINCNFAPVVDVNSNPNNPVINVRSFGNSADIVSEFGESFLKGLHSENIIGTAKHFPGHGDTSKDSHTCLPLVNKSLSDLEEMELKPFRKLSEAGVDMMMVAHIALPNVETKMVISKKTGEKIYLPSTLSKMVINDILREKIGFKGVVITDAMDMKAVSENFEEKEAAKLAINAGADILCMPIMIQTKEDILKLDSFFKYLKNAVESGEISEDKINASVERVIKLKEKYCCQ